LYSLILNTTSAYLFSEVKEKLRKWKLNKKQKQKIDTAEEAGKKIKALLEKYGFRAVKIDLEKKAAEFWI